MITINWDSAPEGTTHWAAGNWYKLSDDTWYRWARKDWYLAAETPITFKECFGKPFLGVATKEQIMHYDDQREKHDPVNNPKHYAIAPNIEAIDIIRAALTPEQFEGYLLGNFLKYRLRAGDKGDLQQDIDKSNWYKRELNK